jgi:hypothetical protein
MPPSSCSFCLFRILLIVLSDNKVASAIRFCNFFYYFKLYCRSHFISTSHLFFFFFFCKIAKVRGTFSPLGVASCCLFTNWFFMTPSIATKFQHINSLLFPFFTHYIFRLLRAILRWDIQLDIWRTIFNTTDPLHVRNLKEKVFIPLDILTFLTFYIWDRFCSSQHH